MLKHQAQAISQMGEARHNYNLGVLAMLGKDRLAYEHEMICRTIDGLVFDRDAATPKSEDLLGNLELTPETAKIQAQIDEASALRNKAWEPIQDLIDEAREWLGKNDPMGLDQHS